MQEAFRAISPILEIQQTMGIAGIAIKNQVLEMQRKAQLAFRAISPILEMQQTMGIAGIALNNQVLEMQRKAQLAFQAISPLLEIQQTIGIAGIALNNQVLEMQKKAQLAFQAISPFLEYQQSVTSSIVNQINLSKLSFGNIIGNVSPILEFIKGLPKEEIDISNNQVIICGPESVDFDSLQENITQILDNIELREKYNSFDIYFNSILTEIRKLKQPFLEKIIVYFIIPLLISIIITLSSPAIINLSNYYFPNNKYIVKYLKKEIRKSDVNIKLLTEYRIVSINELNVREKNRKSSKLIGKVYFGQVIKIIETKKNWSHIEWQNGTNDELPAVKIRGWVFSRYLKKF